MRIVLDTAILVRANTKASGPARSVLERIASGPHQLILSPFLLAETERVLNYPRLQSLYALGPADIEEHMSLLVAVAEIVDPVPGAAVVFGDSHDDPVVYTAITGRADVLCTLDRHFYDPRVVEFLCARSIAVMSDTDLLRLL